MNSFLIGTGVSGELFAKTLPGKAREGCQKQSWNSPDIKGEVKMV